jgi:[pyruvate, water dikinase]-phosphate phosphotransferase / [pyruvate, water dikinase] kinase
MTTPILHVVSDATGETAARVIRACMVQFNVGGGLDEYDWPFVRTKEQVDDVLRTLSNRPGLVVSTLVQDETRQYLMEGCRRLGVQHISLLDPLIGALEGYLGSVSTSKPGRQYKTDEAYFKRIHAMEFAVSHDDGQSLESLEQSDIILLGVSRMSKTPCCIYLAYRGVLAANIPLILDIPLPVPLVTVLSKEVRPLVVGLTQDTQSLLGIRQHRLTHLTNKPLAYANLDSIKREIMWAQHLYATHNIPVINVTNRSIEETAALIIQMLYKGQPHHEFGT